MDASFHSQEWHAARIAALTTERLTWDEWKEQQKEHLMSEEAVVRQLPDLLHVPSASSEQSANLLLLGSSLLTRLQLPVTQPSSCVLGALR